MASPPGTAPASSGGRMPLTVGSSTGSPSASRTTGSAPSSGLSLRRRSLIRADLPRTPAAISPWPRAWSRCWQGRRGRRAGRTTSGA